MVGIITRLKNIFCADSKAVIDRAEKKANMLNQSLRDVKDDIGGVKAETVAVMEEEKRIKRELDECNEEIEKLQRYADKATLAGNGDDANQYLARIQTLVDKQGTLQQAYDLAVANSANMRDRHDQFVDYAIDSLKDSLINK